MERITKDEMIDIASNYAKDKGIKSKYLAIRMGIALCTLSNAKREGMNSNMFKSYIESLGGSVVVETKVRFNRKTYKLK